MIEKVRIHAVKAHKAVNHLYDGKPYSIHLNLAEEIGNRFIHHIPEKDRINVICGILHHDTIEDCNLTFNNVKDMSNEIIAELAFACTNEKGRTRNERANDKYYEGIRNTKYATFVKLCDRIANVEYSLNSKNRMFSTYKKEQSHFKTMLYTLEYEDMWKYLDELLNTKL